MGSDALASDGTRPAANDTAPARGRLNEFQRTMLQWSGLHPYNAVHVAKVAARIEPGELAEAAAAVLREAGLTNYRLEAGGARFRYLGGAAPCEVEVPDSADSPPLATVHREMERQLERPFPFASDGVFQPFRFFLVPAGEATFVGLAYFHAVADADSVARLLAEILAEILGALHGEVGDGAALRDPGLARRGGLHPPMGSPFAALRRIRGTYRRFQAMRRSHRPPPCPATGGYGSRWFACSLDASATAAALSFAKEQGATFNDLCLAAILLAAAPATPERIGQRRCGLSAGCVVNLRHELPEAGRGDFGLALGSFSVTHPLPPGTGLVALLADIREQTLAAKRDKLYLASTLEYRLNRLLLARQRPERRSNFYRKAFPVWGSLTNYHMNLGQLGERARIIDYLRAVSAGPALPWVASVTGFGGRLNFGFAYRPAVLAEGVATAFADRFLELLAGKEAA